MISLAIWMISGWIFAAEFRTGDLIFQSEPGNFAKAIRLATKSPYNHVGMVFIKNGKPYVFEAVGPVKFTSLEGFAQRGIEGRYTVKRLKDADKVLTPKVLARMEALAKEFKGRAYSGTFDWLDDTMYCSELVWKMYERSTGLKIGEFQRMGDFDLSHPVVKRELRKRFGRLIPPGLKLISPGSMAESELLTPVDPGDS
jgi:hypothetical protein